MVNPPEIKNVSTKSSICGLRLPETSNLWIKYGYENGDFIMTCNKKSSIHIIKITKTIIVIFSVPHPSIKNVLLYFLWLSLICYNVNFPFCLPIPRRQLFLPQQLCAYVPQDIYIFCCVHWCLWLYGGRIWNLLHTSDQCMSHFCHNHDFLLKSYRNHCTRLCGDCQLLNTIKQILSLLHSY